MYNFLLSLIIAHGFNDYFKNETDIFCDLDITINYILLVTIIEFIYKYNKECLIFSFILLSIIHFQYDILYINEQFFKNDILKENSLYLSIILITFTSVNEKSKRNYIKILEKINITKNNAVIIYNYTSIIGFFTFIKLLGSYNVYMLVYLYVLYILNIFISNDIYLILYFCLVHIPIDCHKLYLKHNEESIYLYIILVILTFILNNIINKLDIYNLHSNIYISGLCIVYVHILFNLYKELSIKNNIIF